MVVIKLIVSMVIVLLLVSKKVNMGVSLIIGALILTILNKMSFYYILKTFVGTLFEHTTIDLALTIAFITILGYLMDKYGILDRMVSSLEKIIRSKKGTIMLAPTIIGTLLVTGGALMSCPVVKGLGEKMEMSKDKMAAVNLIYRHALYFIFPMAPTVILACQIGEIRMWDFLKVMFPMAISMYILGYLLFLRENKSKPVEKINFKQYKNVLLNFIFYASPIIVSIAGAVIFNFPFSVSLIGGIIIAIFINIRDKRLDSRYDLQENLIITMYKGLKPSMVITIIGIMIFKNVINDMDELYIQFRNLLDMGIPIEFMIIIIAALISFTLANTQPGIALLFPMILPLAPNYHVKLLYAMFIYTTCFVFYYVSPLHLCQVLTLEYFDVKLKDLYKNYKLIIPVVYLVMCIVYIIRI